MVCLEVGKVATRATEGVVGEDDTGDPYAARFQEKLHRSEN